MPGQSLPGPLVLRLSRLVSRAGQEGGTWAAHSHRCVTELLGARPPPVFLGSRTTKWGLRPGLPPRNPEWVHHTLASCLAGGAWEVLGQRVRALWALQTHGLLPGVAASVHEGEWKDWEGRSPFLPWVRGPGRGLGRPGGSECPAIPVHV